MRRGGVVLAPRATVCESLGTACSGATGRVEIGTGLMPLTKHVQFIKSGNLQFGISKLRSCSSFGVSTNSISVSIGPVRLIMGRRKAARGIRTILRGSSQRLVVSCSEVSFSAVYRQPVLRPKRYKCVRVPARSTCGN